MKCLLLLVTGYAPRVQGVEGVILAILEVASASGGPETIEGMDAPRQLVGVGRVPGEQEAVTLPPTEDVYPSLSRALAR